MWIGLAKHRRLLSRTDAGLDPPYGVIRRLTLTLCG